jgi:hypothetical protein
VETLESREWPWLADLGHREAICAQEPPGPQRPSCVKLCEMWESDETSAPLQPACAHTVSTRRLLRTMTHCSAPLSHFATLEPGSTAGSRRVLPELALLWTDEPDRTV